MSRGRTMRKCSIKTCMAPAAARGWCYRHWKRWRKHGDPLVNLKPRHGMVGTPEYWAWSGMIQRCTNKKRREYRYYGKRGIKVCKRWFKFENFFADIGRRPAGKTLDRKDSNGDYTPKNCRWATDDEQRTNKRSRNKTAVRVGRQVHSITEWSRSSGIGPMTIQGRLGLGWSPADAVSVPVGQRTTAKAVTIGRETRSISEWAMKAGIDRRVIGRRLRDGWRPFDAVHTPVGVAR